MSQSETIAVVFDLAGLEREEGESGRKFAARRKRYLVRCRDILFAWTLGQKWCSQVKYIDRGPTGHVLFIKGSGDLQKLYKDAPNVLEVQQF